jgi:hypothetical protein
MRITKILIFSVITMAFLNTLRAQTGGGEHVYVWEFHSSTTKDHKFLDSISDEFEEAVQGTGRYTVIERRQVNRLQDVSSDEITSMHNLGNTNVQQLKLEGASAVFFGDLYNDTNDGTVRLTVTLESFTGPIELKRSVSLRPFELMSRDVRKAKYQELLAVPVTRDSHPPSRPEITTFQYHFLRRDERSDKGLIAFNWTVAPLPADNCKYSLYVGNTSVGSGNQTDGSKHVEVSFLSHLANETKTLRVFCAGKQDEAQGTLDPSAPQ